MQTRFITRLTPAFMMLFAGTGVAQDAPPTTLECFDEYVASLRDCQRDTPPPPDPARDACTEGAFVFLLACYDAEDAEQFVELTLLFDQHLERIAACKVEFPDDPDLYAACVQGSLATLEQQIKELFEDDDDGVPVVGGDTTIPVIIGGGSSTAALGVNNTTSVIPEDANQVPEDTFSSLALLTYDTLDGIVTKIVSHDTDPSDGVSVNIDLSQHNLQQANRVAVTILHLDDAGVILGLQGGVIELNDSGIAGDWNRDGVYDSEDFVTYIDGLVAGVDRTDINDDGVTDGVDLLEFAGQLP